MEQKSHQFLDLFLDFQKLNHAVSIPLVTMSGHRLPNLSDEQWQSIRDAILMDCDTIVETFQDDSCDEYAPVHVKNALYVKKELGDVIYEDGSLSTYKSPWCIWDWMRVFIRNNFYISGDDQNKFIFVNAKKISEELHLASFVQPYNFSSRSNKS